MLPLSVGPGYRTLSYLEINLRYSLRFLALIALSFAMLTLVLALRYEVSYVNAAKGLMKEGFLTGITWLVVLYDPPATKIAPLAPAVNPQLDFAKYDRMEQILQDHVLVSMTHGNTIHVESINN